MRIWMKIMDGNATISREGKRVLVRRVGLVPATGNPGQARVTNRRYGQQSCLPRLNSVPPSYAPYGEEIPLYATSFRSYNNEMHKSDPHSPHIR